MAKDKKTKKGDQPADLKPKKAKGKKHKGGQDRAVKHPLETLSKLADHPLVGELLAAGALAAVAVVAEASAKDPSAVKSADSAKKAGKAAAAAIGARLLKEFTGGAAAAKDAAAKLPAKK